jgi:hypothetical protein
MRQNNFEQAYTDLEKQVGDLLRMAKIALHYTTLVHTDANGIGNEPTGNASLAIFTARLTQDMAEALRNDYYEGIHIDDPKPGPNSKPNVYALKVAE